MNDIFTVDTCTRGLNLDGYVGPEFVNWCRRICQGHLIVQDGNRIAFERVQDYESFLHHFPIKS